MACCSRCGADNPDGARFCNQCGTAMAADIAASSLRRDYTPRHLAERVLRSRDALVGERKRVTVLFADIKGSTRLAEQAGAEAWHGILDRYFALLSAAVHRYEGTVNQYTGDGIMALFGAPVALEDHAQRACFAALAAQAEVRAFADELRLRSGLNLSMRIGLNTGEVIVGRIGDDLRMDYTAQGLTVNLAARMEQICEPGRIYATRYTAALVEGYFRLRDLGAMAVAGVDAPVHVYEVEAAELHRTRLARGLARGASRFVGRDAEFATLDAALQRAIAGQGTVVTVIGEAGIGKSRLCHEFAAHCARAGLPVHRATGVPYAAALPLLPVQTLLRARLGLPENAPTAEIRRLVAGTFLLDDPNNAAILPQVLELLGAGGGRGAEPGGADRSTVLSFLARWLLSSEAPQMLLIEDLHFADAGSEEFIAELLLALPQHPTLLLLNHRPGYRSPGLSPQQRASIAVAPLTADALAELAVALLGNDSSVARLPAQLAQRAAGNPFFVEESVQALSEAGYLDGVRGAYRLVKLIDQWPIADTVHALIAARIDRLPEADKLLLQTASVIGQSFEPAALAALAESTVEQTTLQLCQLQQAEFVEQDHVTDQPAAAWFFRHPLMQEIAYNTQLQSHRRNTHARLATLLEQQTSLREAPNETALRIAHHWSEAGDDTRAGFWHLHAARWVAGTDSEAAVLQLHQALQCLDRADDSLAVRQGRVRVRAALVRMAQFVEMDIATLDRWYEQAMQLAAADDDHHATVELTMSYGAEQLHRGDAETGARLAANSLELARQIGAAELVERFRLAYLLTFSAAGQLRDGYARIDAAGGDDWRLRPIDAGNFISRGFRGLTLCVLGQLDEGERDMRAALAVAVREDRSASWMYANLVEHAWYAGIAGEALQHGRAAVERSERFGSAFFRAVSLRALGLAHCMNGDHASAVPLLEAARPLVTRGGLAHQFEANFLSVLAEAYRGAGRADEALQTARAAVASATASRSRLWEMRAWLALLAQPQLPHAQARDGLQRLLSLIESIGAESLRPWWHLAAARWSDDGAETADQRRQARLAFLRIGAPAHAERLG